MISSAPNINRLWANLIVEELIRSGADFFCLSPGSRSTPLVTAVAGHPRARHVVHFDERGAAFCALGFGRATGRPAVCITTSGSAVANTFPAVVEADADGVPMLLLTADRPPELRGAGANQTIDQVKLFGSHARWFVDLPVPDPAIHPAYVLTTVDQAVQRARDAWPGPVHLNCMFREPLAPDPDGLDLSAVSVPISSWGESDAPYTTYGQGWSPPGPQQVDTFCRLIEESQRGLVVVGRIPSWMDSKPILEMATARGWPVLPDVSSQLRGYGASLSLVGFPALVLSDPAARRRLQPDLTLHLGGPVVSKHLVQFLEETKPAAYVMASSVPARIDPAHRVTHRFECDPLALCRETAGRLSAGDAEYLSLWRLADSSAAAALGGILDDNASVTEPGIGRALGRIARGSEGIFLASSLPIRDVDSFGGLGLPPRVGANRGASGIDGTIASAAGFAEGLRAPVVAIVGDLALLHDLNSLPLARDVRHPLCIIVINNDGGGIFSFLPIAEHSQVFEPFFATPHGLSFQQAAALFKLPYAQAATIAELEAEVQMALSRDGGSLVELSIDRRSNVALHRAIERAIAEAAVPD